MSGPVRWGDRAAEVDPELREVIRYARRQVPDEAQLAALTERVLARVPEVASSPAAVGTGVRLPIALGLKAGAVALCALTCGLGLWSLSRNDNERRTASMRAPAVEPPAATAATASGSSDAGAALNAAPIEGSRSQVHELRAVNAEAASVNSETALDPRPARARRLSDGRSINAQPASRASASDELSLLRLARRLSREEPRAALALAHEHEHQYPNCTFREEREALLVELLFQTGQEAKGRARLQRFLARYPNSAYRALVMKWPSQLSQIEQHADR